MAVVTNEVIVAKKTSLYTLIAEKLRNLRPQLAAAKTSYWGEIKDLLDSQDDTDYVEGKNGNSNVTVAEINSLEAIIESIDTILQNSGNANLISKFCIRELIVHPD